MAFGNRIFAGAQFGTGTNAQQGTVPVPIPTVTSVVVGPKGATILGGQTLQFYAQVFGENNPAQTGTWKTTLGTISSTGLVTAPASDLDDQVGTVTFTSDVDPSFSDSVTFAVPRIAVEPGRRYARPIRDLANSGWRPSSGETLAPMLAGRDSDYIEATGPASSDIALSPVIPPNPNRSQAVRYQAYSPSGDGLAMELRQGDVLIARWEHDVLPPVPTIYEQYLTTEQCDSITDYADLRIRPVAYEAA